MHVKFTLIDCQKKNKLFSYMNSSPTFEKSGPHSIGKCWLRKVDILQNGGYVLNITNLFWAEVSCVHFKSIPPNHYAKADGKTRQK